MRTGPALFRPLDRAGARPDRQFVTVAACTRSCVIGTKTVLSGVRNNSEFAAAWRRHPKWVVSRSLKSVGLNATLVEDDIEAVIRGLKARLVGEIAVSGPELARSLTDLGLIDEYRLYFHPVVLGRGKSFFAGPRSPLRLVSTDPVGEDTGKADSTFLPDSPQAAAAAF